MTTPPTSMVTVHQYREAARAHRASPLRVIQLVEHRPDCRCQEAADRDAARRVAESLYILRRLS